MNEWMITTAISIGIAVISYFLKRTMDQVDEDGKELIKLRNEAATKVDLKESADELKEEVRKIRDDYTPLETHKDDFKECSNAIKEIRKEYLTKDDFIREMAKVDKKLDRITEILMTVKKGAE